MISFFVKLYKGEITYKKLASGALILILILSLGIPAFFMAPKKADAQAGCVITAINSIVGGILSSITGEVPVNDPANNIKEGCLDEIAWTLAKVAIQQMTQSLVQWINTGFNGNPAFVQDPIGFFTGIADQVAGGFIQGSDLGFICSPFQVEIRAALALNQQTFANKTSCTLTGVAGNLENFLNSGITFDFSQTTGGLGGSYNGSSLFGDDGDDNFWANWWQLTTDQRNDPYQAFNVAQAELSIRIQTVQGTYQQDLLRGNGFLSFRSCEGLPQPDPGPQSGTGSTGPGGDVRCPIVTPGSVIVNQLNHILGAPVDTLVTADEINEIIGALLGQLLSQVFGAAQGLVGTSQSNPNYGGGSYLGALGSDAAGQFNSSRDLSNSGISNNISILQQYINLKNQSITLVNTSIGLQNQIVNSCSAFPNNVSAAHSVINNQLQPLINNLQNDITEATQDIATLNDFKTRLNALATNDTAGFNQVLSEYSQFLNQINLDNMYALAKDENKNSLPQQLKTVDKNAQTTINSCTGTGGSSGTGGSTGGSGGIGGSPNH